MPEYKFFNTQVFQDFGTIAWFSDISVPAKGSVNLKVFNTGLSKFTLYIEGIADDGTLINLEKPVNISDVVN